MKRFILLLVLVFSSILLFGQKAYHDVVILNDGKVYKGTILQKLKNGSLRIMTEEEEVILVPVKNIKKVTKEKVKVVAAPDGEPIVDEYEHKGYFGAAEVGFLFGVSVPDRNDTTSYNSMMISSVNGFHLNKFLSLGLGIGVNFRANETYFPITLDLRTYLLQGRFKPYVHTSGGFAFLLKDESSPGNGLLDLAVGLKTYLTGSSALNISAGYSQQFHLIKSGSAKESFQEGFLVVRLGISF